MSMVMTPEAFADQFGVSRETIHRLSQHLTLLRDWSGRMNLVAPSTFEDPWQRHIADSAQLAPLVPDGARRLVDIGSGAGFPGLVLAILLMDRPGFRVTLVESIAKKARFLEAAIAATGAPAQVICGRIEDQTRLKADVVTARACAPLDRLLGWVAPLMGPRSIALLPKGRQVQEELTRAGESWRISYQLVKSQTDPDASILVLRSPPRVRR